MFSSGSSLCELFITALTFGQIIEPVLLWQQFRDSICDDLNHKLQQKFPDSTRYFVVDESLFHNNGLSSLDYGLFLIDNTLKELGSSLEAFNLPAYQNDWQGDCDQLSNQANNRSSPNQLINEQLSYDVISEKSSYESKYSVFNTDQKNAFDTIVTKIEATRPSRCFFLHGPAGTEKTFVFQTSCHYFRSKQKTVLCVASSGIVSLLLPGGRTSHFRFKIPLRVDETLTCFIRNDGELAGLLRETTLIIWDEVPTQKQTLL